MGIQFETKNIWSPANILKALVLSGFGIFSVFVPINIRGNSTILLDFVNTSINSHFPVFMTYFAIVMCFIGVALPFIRKTWKRTSYTKFFSIVGILSIPTAIMYVTGLGPAFLQGQILNTVYNTIIIPWTLVIITGSICVSCLSNFGLFEFVGVFVRPIMRKVFKLPGVAAVNCLACFTGSFTVGSLVTNNLYKEGRYTRKEGVLLLTGFGTVSATFMMLQARVGQIMDYWTIYYMSCLLVTLIVSAITCRLWPLSKVPDTYYNDSPNPEVVRKGNYFKIAAEDALTVCSNSPSILQTLIDSLKQAAFMIWGLMPTMGSVTVIMLIILNYTSVFDILAYIFYPFTFIMGLAEPLMAAKGAAVALVDCVTSCIIVSELGITTRFVICVVSVSGIIFFCGSLPCFLATDLEFSLPKYLLVAVYRIIFSIIVAGLLAIVLF